MIRLGWPVPALWRLRPNAGKVYPATEAGFRFRPKRQLAGLALLRAFLNRRTDAVMKEFQDRYENLVDLLCVCAKEGIQPKHVQQYRELRSWFLAHYRTVRPALQRHLDGDGAAPRGGPDRSDPFQALFEPCALEALLHSEEVISHIQRTRAALAACIEERFEVPAQTPCRHPQPPQSRGDGDDPA